MMAEQSPSLPLVLTSGFLALGRRFVLAEREVGFRLTLYLRNVEI
jgi:hypothetical protein